MSHNKLNDIVSSGIFSPKSSGNSMETKLFATSVEDATAFGKDFYKLDGLPFTIVEVRVTMYVVEKGDSFVVGGRSIIGFGPEMLNELNSTAQVRLLQ